MGTNPHLKIRHPNMLILSSSLDHSDGIFQRYAETSGSCSNKFPRHPSISQTLTKYLSGSMNSSPMHPLTLGNRVGNVLPPPFMSNPMDVPSHTGHPRNLHGSTECPPLTLTLLIPLHIILTYRPLFYASSTHTLLQLWDALNMALKKSKPTRTSIEWDPTPNPSSCSVWKKMAVTY